MTGLQGYFFWKWRPVYADDHPEMVLDAITGTACSVFLIVFLLGGAILGTIHSIAALIRHFRFASKYDKDVS
jgi:hypothetical protein